MTKPKKLAIIYEDKELLVINKPSGLLTIATEKEKVNTLYHQARAYIKKQNPHYKIFIVHRLDKDTSGVILLAKNEKLKLLMQQNWDKVAINREYLALLWGTPKQNKGVIKQYLKETKTHEVYVAKTGKLAITQYEVLKKNSTYSLVKINILTGRKNQIRVAMASIGCPIVGDKKYQAKKEHFHRLCLHAKTLEIIHPVTHQKYVFTADNPKVFDKVFTKEGKEWKDSKK